MPFFSLIKHTAGSISICTSAGAAYCVWDVHVGLCVFYVYFIDSNCIILAASVYQ